MQAGDDARLAVTRRRYMRTRETIAAIAFSIAGPFVLALFLGGAIRFARPAATIITEAFSASAATVLLVRWGWWKRVAWVRPDWSKLWLVWLPVTLALPSVVRAFRIGLSPQRLVLGALAALAVGYAEEAWFRGLLLEGLLWRGPVLAAVVSSAIFGGVHVLNGLRLSSGQLLAQMTAAFGLGLIFAAARIRLRSIWPVVVLHAAFDFHFLASGLALRDVERATLLGPLLLTGGALVYAAALLRNERKPSSLAPSGAVPGEVLERSALRDDQTRPQDDRVHLDQRDDIE